MGMHRENHSCQAREVRAPAERGEPDMTPTLIPDTVADLTAADRCDRCGARASTRVVLAGGNDLLFCGHHSRRYDEALRAVAVEVLTAG